MLNFHWNRLNLNGLQIGWSFYNHIIERIAEFFPMKSFNMLLQFFFSRKRHTTYSTLKWLDLIMDHRNVTIQITLTMKTIIADCADKILTMVLAPNVVYKIRFSLEPLVTMLTSIWHCFVMDQQDMILHSSFGCKTSSAGLTYKWSLLFMHHSFMSVQCTWSGSFVPTQFTNVRPRKKII